MKESDFEIHIFAFSSFGEGLSGGDNIFIELAKKWSASPGKITVHLFQDGYEMCQRAGLSGVEYRVSRMGSRIRLLPLFFLFRTLLGTVEALRELRKGAQRPRRPAIVYSASDFWPDSVPAFIFSRVYRPSRWVAGFYMFAPSPFNPAFPYRGFKAIRGFLYHLTQLPIYLLVKRSADYVFVTSQPDVEKFLTRKRNDKKVIVVKGGIDLDSISSVPAPPVKQFDAVFMGRLHPQKGILELIDIWRLVTQSKPHAKLAVIGDGYLRREVEQKIADRGLEGNVFLFGYKFGREKVEIFKSSKVVLHPATYDSGGMSSCEAMACGLPGVSFDLEALKTYYPQGMVKAPANDLRAFSREVLRLLDDASHYEHTSRKARDLAVTEWSWDRRSKVIFDRLIQDFERK